MDSSTEQELERLMRDGKAQDAVALLQRATLSNPGDADAWRWLAAIWSRAGRVSDAIAAYRRAIAAGGGAKDHHALGMLLAGAGSDPQAAVGELREAVRLDPTYATAWCNLGLVLEDAGQPGDAIEPLRRALEFAVSDDADFIRYHLAALGGGPPPAVCPPDYVVRLFDRYAPRFDEDLVDRLGYRGPWLLRDAVAPLLPTGVKPDVIDLGCGTGLCGMLVRPTARSIVGVDLSSRMIERSRQRGCYDELVQSDLIPALQARRGRADLILAADVFIYVGDLAPVFRAAAEALRPGGLFALTLEVTEEADFAVERSRRYAHSLDYVRRLAAENGLAERHTTHAVLRAGEAGPVNGAVVVLAKDASTP